MGHIQAALILSVTLHSASVKNLNWTLFTSNIPCRVVQQQALPFYTPFVLISLPLVSMWLKNEFNYMGSFIITTVTRLLTVNVSTQSPSDWSSQWHSTIIKTWQIAPTNLSVELRRKIINSIYQLVSDRQFEQICTKRASPYPSP